MSEPEPEPEVTITRDDGEKVELGKDSTSGVVDTVLDMGRHDPENPIPHTQQSGHPDAGFSGIRVRLSVVVHDPLIVEKLQKLLIEDQTTNNLEYGRFSLTHSVMPVLDLTAVGDVGDEIGAGYKIINVHLEVNHQMPHWKTGYILLQLDGDAGRLFDP